MPPRDASLVEERKLAPVYDDIQNERYKSALNTLDRHLKKSPNSSLAHILRSFVLLKTGRPHAEVLSVWRKGVAAADNASGGDVGSRGLWWSGVIMRDLQRWDVLLDMYESLWARSPDNTVLGEQILLISAAAWDTPKMVSASRKMFNLTKAPTWARVAAWAEWADKSLALTHPSSHPFPPPSPNSAALKTAQVLLSTTRKAVPSADVLWLHLQVLLSANDLEGAVAVAKTEGFPGGGVGRTHWRMAAVREVLKRYSGEHDQGEREREGREKASQLASGEVRDFGDLLRNEEDMQRNYANYTYLNHCAITSAATSDIDAVRQLFISLQASIGTKERAPALALLDLDARLDSAPDDALIAGRMSSEDWTAAVQAYWAKWGGKGVIVTDLLSVVAGRRKDLCNLTNQWVRGDITSLDSFMRVKHATLLNLRLDEAWAASHEEFQRLWKLYQSGLPYGVNLPETDVQPADELGLAAVQVLLVLNHRSSAETRQGQDEAEALLVQAITCLRYMLQRSPSCAGAKVALVRLYRLIGAPNLIAKPLDSLKIAEIQLDTVLHIASERGTADAQAGQVGAVLDELLGRATETYKRSASSLSESIKTSIEHESYASIAPIRELAHSLRHSVSRGITIVERARVAVAHGYEDDIDIEALKDIAARKEEEWVDTRNWELFPAYVGVKEGDDPEVAGRALLRLITPGDGAAEDEQTDEGQKQQLERPSQVDGAWCAAWADVLVRVAGVGSGARSVLAEGAQRASMPNSTTSGEKAALLLLNNVLDALTQSPATEIPKEASSAVQGAIDNLVNLAGSSSRWSANQNISLLVEVWDLLRAVQGRLRSAGTSASGKGKGGARGGNSNGKANGASVNVATASGTKMAAAYVGHVVNCVQLGVASVGQQGLDGLRERAKEGEAKWEVLVKAAMGMDEQFIKDAIAEIRAARAAALDKLKSICMTD